MSTNRTFLRHPLVVAGAALGLIVVALLNIHTFSEAGSLFGFGPSRSETHLTPPSNLADVVQEAMHASRSQRRAALAGQSQGPALARDPFTGGSPPVVTQQPAARSVQQRAGAKPLVCTAVFLGGSRSLALIDDEAYGPGDNVRGLDIMSIDADGVWLRRPDGSDIHLEVASAGETPDGYHLVTGVRSEDGQGRTRLTGSSTTEGTER